MKQQLSWLVLLVLTTSITIPGFFYGRQSAPESSNSYVPTPEQKSTPVTEKKSPVQPAAKKQVCFVNRNQAPAIDGLRLGMTLDELLALFPGSRDNSEVRMDLGRPASDFGETSLVIKPEAFVPETKFVGVRQISLNLLDGRVASFNAGYNGPKWKHVDEFVTKFSRERNLPDAADWEAYVGMDNQLKSLRCDGFEISVFAGGREGRSNYIRMNDLTAEAKLEDRRMRFLQKKSKPTKP